MNVEELIKELKKYNPKARVRCLCDAVGFDIKTVEQVEHDDNTFHNFKNGDVLLN